MLPVLSPATRSWIRIETVIALLARERGRGPRRLSALDGFSLLEVFEDIALVLRLPFQRHPVLGENDHDLLAQIADMVPGRECARRGYFAHTIVFDCLQRV